MGDRHDTVTVEPLCMDVTEVTLSAYSECVSGNGCSEPNPYATDSANKWDRGCNWRRPGAEHHPVNCVDWNQATAYCAWAGKRLPSEEEWEWAARGGSEGRIYPWGSAPPTADRLNACGTECVRWAKANVGEDLLAMYPADDGWPMTAPVGSFPGGATAQGLQDMAGNVWEWTSSNYGGGARVRRGGSWRYDQVSLVRSALRTRSTPSFRIASLGFRCAW
jgi:formylglycine-generating enzyme required for sulfatase activity